MAIAHWSLNCDGIGKLKIVFNPSIPPLTKLVPKWMRKRLLESETENILASLREKSYNGFSNWLM